MASPLLPLSDICDNKKCDNIESTFYMPHVIDTNKNGAILVARLLVKGGQLQGHGRTRCIFLCLLCMVFKILRTSACETAERLSPMHLQTSLPAFSTTKEASTCKQYSMLVAETRNPKPYTSCPSSSTLCECRWLQTASLLAAVPLPGLNRLLVLAEESPYGRQDGGCPSDFGHWSLQLWSSLRGMSRNKLAERIHIEELHVVELIVMSQEAVANPKP